MSDAIPRKLLAILTSINPAQFFKLSLKKAINKADAVDFFILDIKYGNFGWNSR